MKIISPRFKDYYDTIAHMYGVDERIIFDRSKEMSSSVDLYIPDERVIPIPVVPNNYTIRYEPGPYPQLREVCEKNNICDFRILSVCGKPFLVANVKGRSYGEVSSEVPSAEVVSAIEDMPYWKGLNSLSEPRRYLSLLHKTQGSPILDISGWESSHGRLRDELSQDVYRFYFGNYAFWDKRKSSSVPNLSLIKGFAKMYPAEQLYQDVSYWLANVLNESPDVQPIGKPPQTDKEKIVSHGLDLKQSFRHRR